MTGATAQGQPLSEIPEDYPAAAQRLYQGGHSLHEQAAYATASHLFGLAVECAIKTFMDNLDSSPRDIPHRHLPDLLCDAKLWLSGRKRSHLLQVIGRPDFMHGWHINNRYWPDKHFNQEDSSRFQKEAKTVLNAARVTL